MVEKVTRYRAADGREFASEEAALRHDAVEGMCEALPELRLLGERLAGNMNAIARAVGPIAAFLQGTHTGDPVEVDHGELAGLCDCSAGMSGSSNHHHLCPAYRGDPLTGERYTEIRLAHG